MPGVGALSGRRVVVTRPRDRAGPLIAALEAEGAEVILLPSIEVVPPADTRPLAEAAARLEAYDWVVFTSVYAVNALEAALVGRPAARRPRVGCVGAATAEAAREAGWDVAVVPEEGRGSALAEALIGAGVGRGTRLLFPRAADAREELPRAVREAGGVVDDPVAYRKVPPRADPGARALIAEGAVDLLTFTSPSTARNFVGELGQAAAAIPAVALGATTAAAARSLGFKVAAVAEERTTAGLVAAVVEALHSRGNHG